MEIKGKINSVSGPRDFKGVMQVGFTLEQDKKVWYNVTGEEQLLKELEKSIILKGAEINFEYNEKTKKVGEINVDKMPEKKEGSWAEDMTNFEDLLSAAHEKFKGTLEIRTEILQDGNGSPMIDFEKKRAVFKATVTADGNLFEGHGETTAENISGETAKSWLRIAETRSIVRALRWATNNATVAQEETGGEKPKDGKPIKK